MPKCAPSSLGTLTAWLRQDEGTSTVEYALLAGIIVGAGLLAARQHDGDDPLAGIAVPRAARIDRLRQVALNVALRLRASLVDAATRDERLAPVIARAAGPLRAAALTLLELEGTAAATSKEAFGRIAGEIDAKRAERLLPEISRARESASVTPGAGAETVLLLVDVALAIGVRVERLDRGGAP